MNNKELTAELSRRLGYTNKDVERLLGSVVDIISSQLQENKVFTIQGFGNFYVCKKKERVTGNPATKQRFLIPPRLVLLFKPAIPFKEKLKNKSTDER